jgi:type III restriction enzyme
MGFKLEKLDYQEDAIQSVVNIFEGQEKNTFDNACHYGIRSNIGTLSQDEIQHNIKNVISENNIPEELAHLSTANDLCIEMETGTGKTLVYLKTIFELYKEYGFTKFIILVPSVPIREGVISTLDEFGEQLEEIYGFIPEYFEYSSDDLTRVKTFIEEQFPQIMIMTLQSFNKDDNILNREQREDLFNNISYIEAIGKTQPFIIMDEPQEGMDTENSQERISKLNPLFKLRYSATHKVMRNLLYRLTPYDAYDKGLVKKIEVFSVAEKNDEATLKLEVSRVRTRKNGDPQAKLRAWRWFTSKQAYEFKETPWLNAGDSLYEATGNISYRGYDIDRIYKGILDQQFKVKFTNDIELIEKEQSKDFSGIFREQLYWLIWRHFKKREKLKGRGIKCLSLIFIDKVDNYIKADGLVRQLFEEEYAKIYKEEYSEKPTKEQIEKVQGSYFARTTNGDFTDSEYSMSVNSEIYDRILNDKEGLLKFDDSIEFIFSHSALGVGWDNPNVFNIATLNHSYSEIKKRQEIGRGLRICVNQEGQRVYDKDDVEEGNELNLLSVIPNETYKSFVSQYQEQIKEAYGTTDAAAETRHTHKGKDVSAKTIKRNDDLYNSPSFKDFWDRLARKTSYTVTFDEEQLVEKAIEKVNRITIPEYEVETRWNRIQKLHEDQIEDAYMGSGSKKLKKLFAPIDIVEELSENTGLSYNTTMAIVTALDNEGEIAKNPPRFVQEASHIINQAAMEEMVRVVEYDTTGEQFDIAALKKEVTTYSDHIKPTPKRGIYNKIVYDSKVEKEFAGYADNDKDEVVCFLKLPPFYKIPMPTGGTYNPDFGVVLRKKDIKSEEDTELHFVIETKNTNDIDDRSALSEEERMKIKCAQKHFEAIGINLNFNDTSFKAPIKDWQTFVNEADNEFKRTRSFVLD